MKSVKPGRGPSKMSMVGSIAAAAFGVFWCIMAASMGAVFMVPFGIVFIGVALYNAVNSYHNVTSEDRYSIIDIVEEDEETDPLNQKYGRAHSKNIETDSKPGTSVEYCPYCGTKVDSNFDFCPKCGKNLPD